MILFVIGFIIGFGGFTTFMVIREAKKHKITLSGIASFKAVIKKVFSHN